MKKPECFTNINICLATGSRKTSHSQMSVGATQGSGSSFPSDLDFSSGEMKNFQQLTPIEEQKYMCKVLVDDMDIDSYPMNDGTSTCKLALTIQ